MIEDMDPLEEREKAAEEVTERRLLESMDEEATIQQLARVLADEDMRDVLWRIIGWCGIFTDPMSSNFGWVAHGLGKAAIGKRLMVEINVADPQAWLAMQLKSAKVASDAKKAESLKRLRKGRST